MSLAHAPSEPAQAQPSSPSFLARVGQVALAIVKHVPTRAILWAGLSFVLGWGLVGLSLLIMTLHLERGIRILEILFPIPLAIPFAGAALFAMHGAHRGAARAALELERKFGLVRYVVDRVIGLLEPRVGERLANLPVAELEQHVKAALDTYLGSDDMREGAGVTGWVVRRAKRAIVRRLETYLLAAYREEMRVDGGGGVSLAKVGARVSEELSRQLAGVVMSPLNKQLLIFMLLYVVVGVGWFYILVAILGLFSVTLGAAT